MIKVEHIEVYGWEAAIRGMRNPMNSWAKSDSYKTHIEDEETLQTADFEYFVGENDMDLMKRLYKGGPVHAKYLRQIMISLDITAPLYWWKEFDTYKVGTTANSCSTMHKIHAKEFDYDDFSHEHLLLAGEDMLWDIIDVLNMYRDMFLRTKDKQYWWQMIQLLPSSYNQKRTITMNYANVMNMLDWRSNHKLDEWCEFCEILRELPYVKEIRDE